MNKQTAIILLKHLGAKGRKLVEGLEAGEYKSAFRGEGVEFKEVRPYQWGDDLRQMDWNVTARMGSPYVKELTEERELTHIAILDKSSSMNFGTTGKLKSDLAFEIASLLSFMALSHKDRFGMLLYGNGKLSFFPPVKGEKNILAVLKKANEVNKTSPGKSMLENALVFLRHVMKKRSHIFVLSDFFDPVPEKIMKVVSKRHEVFPFVITDPAECELPRAGDILLRDLETGKIFAADTGSGKVREAYRLARANFYSGLKEKFLLSGTRPFSFSTAPMRGSSTSPSIYAFIAFLRSLAFRQ